MFAVHDVLAGNLGMLWQVFQAPIWGGLATLALILLGRWLRWPLFLAAPGGLGVALGWLLLTKSPSTAVAGPALKLMPIAASAAVLCPLAARLLPRWGTALCLGVLAVCGGWWLAGGPRGLPAALHVAGLLLAMVLFIGLGGRLLVQGGMRTLLLGGFSLAGALWVAKAPAAWLLLALAPALVSLALVAVPAAAELVLLPVAVDVLAAALGALLAAGRLSRLGLNAIDTAALAPILAVLLAPRLRVQPPVGAVLAGGIAIFLAWAAHAWLNI